MAPAERDILTTGQRSLNARKEKPFHVSEHQPHVTNMSWPTLGIQYAKIVEIIAPGIPRLKFIVKSHERDTWITMAKAAKNAMMTFLLWDCRNIWVVKEKMKENMIGIAQREMVPATCAMLSSWPKRIKIGLVNMNTGTRTSAVNNKTIHDLWRYTPIMLYSFAPNACPQSVDNALAIPNCNFQFTDTNNFCDILWNTLSSNKCKNFWRKMKICTYQNTIGKANENSEDKGKSSKFPWANMTNKSLTYDIETEGGEPSEYGWCCHYPHRLALVPHPLHQRWIIFFFFLWGYCSVQQLLL